MFLDTDGMPFGTIGGNIALVRSNGLLPRMSSAIKPGCPPSSITTNKR